MREQAIERTRRWGEENLDRFQANQRRMRSTPEFKARARAAHLKRKYGISVQEYEDLLASQDGGCAICGDPPRERAPLHVDHNHQTGRVRGLLCFKHNNALGDFDDDPDLLRAALRYVEPAVERDPLIEARTADLKARRLVAAG